jgi:hypothetical protein
MDRLLKSTSLNLGVMVNIAHMIKDQNVIMLFIGVSTNCKNVKFGILSVMAEYQIDKIARGEGL